MAKIVSKDNVDDALNGADEQDLVDSADDATIDEKDDDEIDYESLPASVREKLERLSELEEKSHDSKSAHDNAKNLRLKSKKLKEEKETLAAELAEYKAKEEEQRLASLSDNERLQALLEQKENEKAAIVSQKEQLEIAQMEKDIENVMLRNEVRNPKLLKPFLLEAMKEDDFDSDEFFGTLKKDEPHLFKTVKQKKSVGNPPGGRKKEADPTGGEKKWGGRSESKKDRLAFKKEKEKYGISV